MEKETKEEEEVTAEAVAAALNDVSSQSSMDDSEDVAASLNALAELLRDKHGGRTASSSDWSSAQKGLQEAKHMNQRALAIYKVRCCSRSYGQNEEIDISVTFFMHCRFSYSSALFLPGTLSFPYFMPIILYLFFAFVSFIRSKRVHGSVHYNVALVENNLGLTLGALGDVNGAVEALHAAADTWAALQGQGHPQVR